MGKQMLYLMLGFPGSGKTTASKIIHAQTGAVHLWADHERRKRFTNPTHSHEENLELYAELNDLTDQLLGEGKSVIFDTNFSFYKDRVHLREIAAKHDADTVVVWVRTPKELARERATKDAHIQRHTRVLGDMSVEDFERMSNNIQTPHSDERVLEIEGKDMSAESVAEALASL
jgi:predicted kinase